MLLCTTVFYSYFQCALYLYIEQIELYRVSGIDVLIGEEEFTF